MAVFGPIPLPKPGEGLKEGSDWMHKLLMAPIERREKEASAKHQQALADLEGNPLKLDLLRAQIEHQRALANRASRTGGSGEMDEDGYTELTKPSITQNQKTVQAIDNVLPQITQLSQMDIPGQAIGKYLHPDKQTDYEAHIAGLTDTLVSALQLPKTNESLALADKMVRQHPLESKDAYNKRIKNLARDLAERRQRHMQSLRSGRVGSESNQESSERTVTIKDDETGEVMTVPISQARSMGIEGV